MNCPTSATPSDPTWNGASPFESRCGTVRSTGGWRPGPRSGPAWAMPCPKTWLSRWSHSSLVGSSWALDTTDSRISSVLSLAVNLRLDAARGAIHVDVSSLRAGCLPVPRMLVDARARKALDREAGRQIASLLRRVWSQAGEYLPVDTSLKGGAAAEVPLAAMLGDISGVPPASQEPLAQRRIPLHHLRPADRTGQANRRCYPPPPPDHPTQQRLSAGSGPAGPVVPVTGASHTRQTDRSPGDLGDLPGSGLRASRVFNPIRAG